ncbi:MAG: type II toxin-antitoxin system death-on-curing family toxin [Acidobacteriota bacterium]
MATEQIYYPTYLDAVSAHFDTMKRFKETRYGIFERALIESALARPRHAAIYENADIFRQASTLCFGFIKNHPWMDGNKRTATAITEGFLLINGWRLHYSDQEIIDLSLAIESNLYGLNEIEAWYRQHSTAR